MTDTHRPEQSLADFRSRFAHLSKTVHLASCSQGALSVDLNTALFELQHTMRDQGAPWGLWTAEVEQARSNFAAQVNCSPDEVAIVSCASDAAYQVASSLSWSGRPRIITSDMEFPSIAHVWLAQQSRGAEVIHVPQQSGVIADEEYSGAVDEQAGLVSIPLVSYRNGARMPVQAATEAARSVGARVFIDAYQACGVLPIDVQKLDCDYLVSGSLKYLLGLPGIAFLYVRRGTTDDVAPQLTGWFGQQNPFEFDPRHLSFADDARRFQTGTPPIPSAYAANAGFRALSHASAAAIDAQVQGLVEHAHRTLIDDGEVLFSPADPHLRGPMVAITDENPGRLAEYLAAEGINTSPRGQYLRLSFHGYNDSTDVETACEAIRDYRKNAQ